MRGAKLLSLPSIHSLLETTRIKIQENSPTRVEYTSPFKYPKNRTDHTALQCGWYNFLRLKRLMQACIRKDDVVEIETIGFPSRNETPRRRAINECP